MKPHRFLSSNSSLVIFNLFYPGYTTKINISVNSFSHVSLLCEMFMFVCFPLLCDISEDFMAVFQNVF